MSFMSKFWGSTSPIAYHSKLETPLLKFGKKDYWRLIDAFENTLICGGVGAGKSSASGAAIARSFLKNGMGGLILAAKGNEADRWEKLCAETGRSRDVIRFDASGTHRFSFMDYVLASPLGRNGYDQNLSAALLAAAEAARLGKSSGGGDNPFFRDAAEELLLHALPILKVARGRLHLAELMRFIDTAPTSAEQTKAKEWLETSFCAQCLLRCGELADQGDTEAERIAEEHIDYFVLRLSTLGERTRGSIIATLTSTLSMFLSGKVHELFCTDTTLVPEMTQEGAIIILDFSVHEFGAVGAIMQAVFKSLWMKSVQQRKVETGKMRPVFQWIDECHYFLTSQDSEFLSTSREYGACPVYITQDLPTFYAAIGGSNAEQEGRKLVAKFQTRIFHANTDPDTNNYASEIIGKVEKKRMSRGVNQGVNTSKHDDAGVHAGGGNSQGTSSNIETYDDFDMHPEAFGNVLRTGAKQNRYRVDAMVIRSARTWKASGRNSLKVTFHQKAK